MRTILDHERNSGVFIGEAVCLNASPKAIRVSIGGQARWIPQSCVHDDSEVWKPGQQGRLIVLAWFAEKEGL